MQNTHNHLIKALREEMEYRNYSPRSIHTYCSFLEKLGNYLATPLDQISQQQFKDYLHMRITADGISTSGVNQAISAFKILQTDILGREWETIKIKRPRREKRLPVILSLSEVERMISATMNLKHRALLMLAYSSGLRRQEIQTMKPSDIDSERMRVRVVQAKGRKDRYTILSTKTLEILRLYYKFAKPSNYLFEAQGKKGSCLSGATLHNIVKINAAKAGIKKNISFHTLRHCFATHLLESGIDIRLIQKYMGHSSLRTTAVYLHMSETAPAGIISPMDSMNI
jgi:integrase/recombinase XerD